MSQEWTIVVWCDYSVREFVRIMMGGNIYAQYSVASKSKQFTQITHHSSQT